MKPFFIAILSFFFIPISNSQNVKVSSPDGLLQLEVITENGTPLYSVTYQKKTIIEKSPLGLITNEGDFSL